MKLSQYFIILGTIWAPKGKVTRDHTIDFIMSGIFFILAIFLMFKEQ